MHVPYRPLLFVSGLTVGDYMLWNWSLSGNHGALALVSGLTLPPLALACVWLVVLNLLRLLMSRTRPHTPAHSSHHAKRTPRRSRRTHAPSSRALGEHASSTASAGRSSSKLAA